MRKNLIGTAVYGLAYALRGAACLWRRERTPCHGRNYNGSAARKPGDPGSGYYTYCREMTPLMVERWKNKTLHDYFGDTDRESGIAALNLIIDNYNKGVKVTYQVYTPEEIEHNSSLGCVQLFYYPAETPTPKPLS